MKRELDMFRKSPFWCQLKKYKRFEAIHTLEEKNEKERIILVGG